MTDLQGGFFGGGSATLSGVAFLGDTQQTGTFTESYTVGATADESLFISSQAVVDSADVGTTLSIEMSWTQDGIVMDYGPFTIGPALSPGDGNFLVGGSMFHCDAGTSVVFTTTIAVGAIVYRQTDLILKVA